MKIVPDFTPPPTLPFNPEFIPAGLRQIRRWAPYELMWNEGRGKYDKIPHSPSNPEFRLGTNNVDAWTSFDAAKRSLKANQTLLSGLGYLMTGKHGIVGYDLDGCVHDGVIDEWASDIVKQLGSYAEFSVSGNGIRVFCLGDIDADWTNHDQGIEVYVGTAARFLTLTGQRLTDAPEDLTEPDPEVHEAIANKYRKAKPPIKAVELPMPDLLEDIRIPDGLPEKANRFLSEGECHDPDRSKVVAYCAICLIEAGLTPEETFSALMHNPFAHGVAMDHRKQNEDKAALWIWKNQVLPAIAKQKAKGPDAFEDCSLNLEHLAGIPEFRRDKNGNIKGSISNTVLAVGCPEFVGMEIRFDAFKDEISLSRDGGVNWESLTDPVYTQIRIDLENRGFVSVGREMVRDAVENVALANHIDTAIQWLNNIIPPWDGVSRIENFCSAYLRTADTEYTRAVSRYLWTAMAGRVLSPGIKADMALILVGRQGIRKTSACRALVPSDEFFTEIDIDERRESDNSRKMRGVLVAELAELKGLQTREAEYVKAFISRTDEEWIPKFKEHPIKVPRRLVFIGTTNSPEFLNDEEERRWLPVDVGLCDVDAITRDRDQLWAEARDMFKAEGIAFQDAESLAKKVHHNYKVLEPWTEQISRWLDTEEDFGVTPRNRDYLTTGDVMRDALRIEVARFDKRSERRIGAALRQLGFERIRKRIGDDGSPTWVWAQPTADECSQCS